MAAPTVRGWATTPTLVTDFVPAKSLTAPTRAVGDLLIAWVAVDTAVAAGNIPAAWTTIENAAGASDGMGIFGRIATNDASDDFSCTGANNQDGTIQMVAITVGTHGVTDPATDIIIGTRASGASGNANPPAITGQTAADYLAFAFAVVDHTALGASISGYPTNYPAGQIAKSANTTSSISGGVGVRALSAATGDDPGTFTNTSGAWIAQTLFVPPANPNATVTPATISTAITLPAITKSTGTTVSPTTNTVTVTTPDATATGGGGEGTITATVIESGQTTKQWGTDPWSTASFSPAAGSVLIVFAFVDDDNFGNINTVLTITDNLGTPLTYNPEVLGGRSLNGSEQGKVWSAVVGAGGPMTITFDFSSGALWTGKWIIYQCTGADTANPVEATAFASGGTGGNDSFEGAQSITLNTAPASTSVVLAGVGVNATISAGVTNVVDPGAGWTEDVEVFTASTNDDYAQTQQRTGSTSTSVAWADVQFESGSILSFSGCMMAVEVRAGAPSGDATVTPEIIAATATLPAITKQTGWTVAPDLIAAAETLPAFTVQTGSGWTSTPDTALVTTTEPAPAVQTGWATAPAALIVTGTLPTVDVQTIPPVLYPASISGRKLLDQNGDVILIKTMSSWALASNLSDADITTALEGVAARGFNSVTVWAGGGYNIGTGWHTYTNNAGQNWWTGTPWQSSLGAAWASMDHVVSECARLGLFVNFSICGGNGTTGARPDWEAATNAQMRQVGIDVATRYDAYDNIIWHAMLDDAQRPEHTAGQRVEAYFDGINDTEGASRRPVRWMEQANTATTDDQGWLNTGNFACSINCFYSYNTNMTELIEGVYAQAVVPVGDCEAIYDGNTGAGDAQQLRERQLATFLEGGCVENYGHEDWWTFGASGFYTEGLTWDEVMAHSHTVYAGHIWELLDEFVTRTDYAPTSSFVTTGQGTGGAKAAIGMSNVAALAMFPDSRTIVVDTTVLPGTGNVRLRWWDATAASYAAGFTTIAASEAQNASRSVTHPGTNNAGGTDWVLVVDLTGGADATVTPAVISAAVTTPTPTEQTGWTSAPAMLSSTVTEPTVVAQQGAQRTPATFTAVMTVPAPTAKTGWTVAPAVVNGVYAFLDVTVFTAGNVTVVPAVLIAGVTEPPVIAQQGAQRAPTVVNIVVTGPAVVVQQGAQRAVAALIASVTVPAPSVRLGWTTTPAVLTVIGTLPDVSVVTGGSATTHPEVLLVVATTPAVTTRTGWSSAPGILSVGLVVPQATPSIGKTIGATALLTTAYPLAPTVQTGSDTTVQPAVALVNATTPSVVTRYGWTATPGVLAATIVVPQVGPSAGWRVNPAVVISPTTLPPVTATGGAGVSPAVLQAIATLASPSLRTDWSITSAVLMVIVTLPAPFVVGNLAPDENPITLIYYEDGSRLVYVEPRSRLIYVEPRGTLFYKEGP